MIQKGQSTKKISMSTYFTDLYVIENAKSEYVRIFTFYRIDS